MDRGARAGRPQEVINDGVAAVSETAAEAALDLSGPVEMPPGDVDESPHPRELFAVLSSVAGLLAALDARRR